MAPSFLADLRKRSKTSFSRSTEASDASNGNKPNSRSRSHTPALNGNGASSPPLTESQSMNTINTPPVPPRPIMTSNSSRNRWSMSGLSGLGALSRTSSLPVSQYSPRILSITDNSWVYQKVLSIYGTVGDPQEVQMDGIVTITRADDAFPPISWPVCDSHFKALVYLTPGPNKIRFDFTSPKLANSNTSNPIHSSSLTLHMLPTTTAPPLQLVILLGSDSPATFDAVPSRVEQEGNGLETAIRKFRMSAYLWQAFTAEQMFRGRLGRRVFRFEEEWVTGTSNYRDRELGTQRSEAKVHVVRSSKTVAEIRDHDLAQQNPGAKRPGDLFGIAADAVRDYFKPAAGQKQYVSVLFLDSHYDKEAGLITGHAALGGVVGDIQLAIFGSQALQSYPSSFEEVVPAFTDCTPTDTNHVANDCNESGSSWEAANIGIGAHLHETGHLFGCPHQENGVMLRDYVTLNRSFTTREPFSTRTGSKGGLVLPKDECTWHRLDLLRFRIHPAFAIPTDPPRASDGSIQVWPVDNGNVIVTASSGVAFLEIYSEGDDNCHTWIEYSDGTDSKNGTSTGPIQRQILLTEAELRARLPEDKKKAKFKISVKSIGGGSHDVDDFAMIASKASRIKLPNGQLAFRGSQLGLSQMNGSQPQEVIFHSAIHQTKLLTSVKVYHGFALDGIEFFYEDATTQLFGKRGGKPGGDEFGLDTRRGEVITGFYLRAGLWIDGLAIMTSLGRKSPTYGNAAGGSGHTLYPPRGYCIAGITGSCADWLDGFGIVLTR